MNIPGKKQTRLILKWTEIETGSKINGIDTNVKRHRQQIITQLRLNIMRLKQNWNKTDFEYLSIQ